MLNEKMSVFQQIKSRFDVDGSQPDGVKTRAEVVNATKQSHMIDDSFQARQAP